MTNREVIKGLLKSGGLKPAFALSLSNGGFCARESRSESRTKAPESLHRRICQPKQKHDNSIVIVVSTSVRKLIGKTTDGPHS